mgnify:FL=1
MITKRIYVKRTHGGLKALHTTEYRLFNFIVLYRVVVETLI